MKAMPRCFWKCKECEGKSQDLKHVLDSMAKLHSEMKKSQEDQQSLFSEMKKSQEDQQKERQRVLEGLERMETAACKIDQIEKVQEEHEERLADHAGKIKKNSENLAHEKERISVVEERIDKIDADALNVRQTNAVVR